MSKLLTNQISNYNDNGPVEAKEGLNVANGKPFQVDGANGTSGDYLKSTGSSIEWSTFPSIPAAQVNVDWNSNSGVTQILNKPTLATVATTGSYNDLINLPTIPAAQLQSDWNQSNSASLDFIKNKPTIFSGNYSDLSGRPSIPATISDLSDVNLSNPVPDGSGIKWDSSTNRWVSGTFAGSSYTNSDVDNHLNITGVSAGKILSWNGSDYAWVDDQTGGGGGGGSQNLFSTIASSGQNNIVADGTTDILYIEGGSGISISTDQNTDTLTITATSGGTFTGLTDTPANFTSQAGKYLRVNAGANALEYVTLPVDPDTNTTYSQSSVADGSNVKLRLTDSGSTNDDILLTAGTNITFTSVTSGGFTINHTGNAVASVVTDDNAPNLPSDGDLWWKSDEGRLKVYYQDANSSQWVDANPPLPSTSISNGTTNGTNSVSSTTSTGGVNANAIEIKTDNSTASAVRWRFTPNGHLLPSSNADYDIGSAEYKVRHLFLSDNTVYFQGDFLKVAQHNSGGSAQSPSYLIPLAKLKDALNASADYEAFKTAILAITDA